MATQGDYLSLPARTIGVWPASGAAAWIYGSWRQLIDRLGLSTFVSGVQFQVGAILATLDTAREIMFEIGVGLSGSEVVKIQTPYSIRLDTAVGYYKSSGYNSIFFPEPMFISAGSSLIFRVADSFVVAVTYDGFRLIYLEVIDPTVALGGLSDFAVILSRSTLNWYGVSIDSSNQNVYAAVVGGDIYKQTSPTPLLEKVSVSDTGLTDITNSSNTHPFPTGKQIKHTVQSADILGSGVYYWRVSARDPLGTNFCRSWTSPQSFMLLTDPKTWNGAIWDYKPLKVWDGTSWIIKG